MKKLLAAALIAVGLVSTVEAGQFCQGRVVYRTYYSSRCQPVQCQWHTVVRPCVVSQPSSHAPSKATSSYELQAAPKEDATPKKVGDVMPEPKDVPKEPAPSIDLPEAPKLPQ